MLQFSFSLIPSEELQKKFKMSLDSLTILSTTLQFQSGEFTDTAELLPDHLGEGANPYYTGTRKTSRHQKGKSDRWHPSSNGRNASVSTLALWLLSTRKSSGSASLSSLYHRSSHGVRRRYLAGVQSVLPPNSSCTNRYGLGSDRSHPVECHCALFTVQWFCACTWWKCSKRCVKSRSRSLQASFFPPPSIPPSHFKGCDSTSSLSLEPHFEELSKGLKMPPSSFLTKSKVNGQVRYWLIPLSL